MDDGVLRETEWTYSPRLDALRSWLPRNNVQLSSKLEIRAVPSPADATHAKQQQGSFAIYTLNDVRQHEILAVIPRRAILSKRTCSLANIPSFDRLCTHVEAATPQQAAVRILATAMTYEILLGRESRWHGYILSMPHSHAEVGLPTYWEDEQALSWLHGTDVTGYLDQKRCTRSDMESFFDEIALPCLQEATCLHNVSPEAFKLGFSLVLSRAFYVDNYHGLSMVPLADVFNHHFQPHATLQSDVIVCPTCGSRTECEHDDGAPPRQVFTSSVGHSAGENARVDPVEEDDTVEMVATANVSAGMEVFNTYGKLDNAALLANYGFMLEANDDDTVRWFSVASLCEQAGLYGGCLDGVSANQQWLAAVKNEPHRLGDTQDNRISPETPTTPHLRQPFELLFIDADGAVSKFLMMLLRIARQAALEAEVPMSGEGLVDALGESLQTLIRNRLQTLAGRRPDTPELFNLIEQAETSPEAKIAISRLIDERLLLSACLAQWTEDASSWEMED